MLSFEDIVNDIKEDTSIEKYFLDIFKKQNYKEYKTVREPNTIQRKAIQHMFTSKDDLLKRVDDAFAYDEYCIEAFFVYLMLKEDVFIQLRFDAYLQELNNYPGFDEYRKYCYIRLLSFYVDFLLDIDNVTKAISIQKLIVKLTNEFSPKSVSILAYCYNALENADDFYRLYAETSFGTYEYLLLLVTLLIHDEKLKAQEVLLDMYKNIEYSTYLDHVWDLDENDPEQKKFADIVEDCYDDLKAVPTFFSWVNRTREKYGK